MSISETQARELQRIVRCDPRSGLTSHTPPSAPTQEHVETSEQREQRLLDELDAVRKAKEKAAEAAKAEEAKKSRLDAIDRATALSQATTDVLQAIRGQVNYNTGDVVSRDTWWKFRRELASVVAAHGFKLVNVGTKSKPRCALVEV